MRECRLYNWQKHPEQVVGLVLRESRQTLSDHEYRLYVVRQEGSLHSEKRSWTSSTRMALVVSCFVASP